MRRVRVCGRVLIGLLAIQCLSSAANLSGQVPERHRRPARRSEALTRTFSDQKCRFTLPDPKWQWAPVRDRSMLFYARHVEGPKIHLLVNRGDFKIDEAYVKGYDATVFTDGIQKRDGQFITYAGVRCYEAKGWIKGDSVVFREFNAHGYHYSMTIIGGAGPVEETPYFEELVQGFEFTTAPEPVAAGQAGTDPDNSTRAYRLGRIVGQVSGLGVLGLLGGIAVLAIVRASNGKQQQKSSGKKRRPKPVVEDDDA